MSEYANNKEIVDSFIQESFDLLENAENSILELEKGYNIDTINSIFRSFHSIKGSAGFLNFNFIKSITHETETLFDLVRKNKITLTKEDIDIVFKMIDFIKKLIKSIETNNNDNVYQQEFIENISLIKDLNSKYASLLSKDKENVSEKKEEKKEEFSIDVSSLITDDMREKGMVEFYENIEELEKDLLDLEKNPYEASIIAECFRKIHSFKGNVAFFGYRDLEELSMEIETFLDAVRNNKVTITPKNIELLFKAKDALIHGLKSIDFKNPSKQNIPDKDLLIEELKKASEQKATSGIFKPIGEILVEIGAASEEKINEALKEQKVKLGEILVEKGIVKPDDLNKALEIQKSKTEQKPISKEINIPLDQSIQKTSVRVDTVKLDTLFNLIGELITAEAMVTNNYYTIINKLNRLPPDILEGLDSKISSFDKASAYLSKITREIQEITMSIRMLPLEQTFNKMNRLVRDLSRKFDKEINFIIKGAETEMDRNIIEEISDPLVHILRNAIDHGIEPKSERIRKNKNPIGTIKLEAKYEGNEIWIIIEDDGQGLNKEKILKKAEEKNLLKKDKDKYTDKEIWNIIFEPGFSTAEKVTDVSGRGVGMDVVKRNIEKIKGKIDIFSEEGKGTKFILKIPLTLAIMDGIIVLVGDNKYSIPLNDIVESFKLKKTQLTKTEEGNLVVNLRGELLPLILLYKEFKTEAKYKNPEDGVIMVVQSNEKKACLLVDEILENQQIVVKSLSNYIGSVEGITGCTILGNGEISLILDIANLIKRCIE